MTKMAVCRLAFAAACFGAFLYLSHLSKATFSARYPNFIDLVVSGNSNGKFCLTGKTVVVTGGSGDIVVEREGFQLKVLGVRADPGDAVFAAGTLTHEGLIPSQVFVVKNYELKRGAMYATGFLILLLLIFHLLRWFVPPSIKVVKRNG